MGWGFGLFLISFKSSHFSLFLLVPASPSSAGCCRGHSGPVAVGPVGAPRGEGPWGPLEHGQNLTVFRPQNPASRPRADAGLHPVHLVVSHEPDGVGVGLTTDLRPHVAPLREPPAARAEGPASR